MNPKPNLRHALAPLVILMLAADLTILLYHFVGG